MKLDPRCSHCGQPIPYLETARTMKTPDGHAQLPVGSGWVVCGDCLPRDQVFYRPVGHPWRRP